VTFPPERVMSALAPIPDGIAPPTQPRAQADMSSSDDATNRARRALFGT
jgi:hypothetical protein